MIFIILICIVNFSVLNGFPFIISNRCRSHLNSDRFGIITNAKSTDQQRRNQKHKKIINELNSNTKIEAYRNNHNDDDLYYTCLNESNDTMMRYKECQVYFETQNDNQTMDFVGAGTLGDIMSSSSNQLKNFNSTTKIPFSKNQTMSLISSTTNDKQINPKLDERTSTQLSSQNTKIDTNDSSNIFLPTTTLDGDTSSVESGLVTTTGGTIRAKYSKKMNGYITPLERIALTANGNLQRIFSSFYDAPVHVIVDKCQLRIPNTNSKYYNNSTSMDKITSMSSTISSHAHSNHNHQTNNAIPSSNYDLSAYYHRSSIPAIWDRAVHLSVHDQKFCTAYSQINVYSQECIDLVCSGKIGIGQIFRYLDKLPTFHLLDAGRLDYVDGDDGDDGVGGMWREYLLSCEELECHIREEFTCNAWCITPDE